MAALNDILLAMTMFAPLALPGAGFLSLVFVALLRRRFARAHMALLTVLWFAGTYILFHGLLFAHFFRDGLGPGFVPSAGGVAFERTALLSLPFVLLALVLHAAMLVFLRLLHRRAKHG